MNEVIIDRRAFDAAVDQFAKESGLSAHDVLKDQMRLFVSKAAAMLPPNPTKENGDQKAVLTKAALEIGEKRIEMDVSKVLGVIDDQQALNQLNAMFKNRLYPLNFNTGNIGPALKMANKYRSKKGRVTYKADTVKIPNTTMVFCGKTYVSRAVRDWIVLAKKQRVGRLKAGWEAAATMLGARLPSWITRHNSPGSAVDTIKDGKGYIEAINGVSYAARHAAGIEKVLQGRVRAITTRIDKELFRLAKKVSAK